MTARECHCEELEAVVNFLMELLENPGCSCGYGSDNGELEGHSEYCMYRRVKTALLQPIITTLEKGPRDHR